tara:strand:- start:211 stop:444 length:234 start_codon:yes stop_codon:yes gene_type:complete
MKRKYVKPSYSQWWEQNSLRDRIEMQVLSANYSMENLLDELDMTYKDAYEEKLSTDELIELVVEKRLEEYPHYEEKS